MSLYVKTVQNFDELPDPPSTEVINSAIILFAASIPLQPARIQESILEQLTTFMTSSSLQRDPGRSAAITVNVAMALLAALKVATKETAFAAGNMADAAVEKILQDLLGVSAIFVY